MTEDVTPYSVEMKTTDLPDVTNPEQRPWLTGRLHIRAKHLLPDEPGLYFVVVPFTGEVLYVGMSRVSLRKRWVGHNQMAAVNQIIEVAYIEFLIVRDLNALRKLEQKAIKAYRPRLNWQGRRIAEGKPAPG